MTESLDVVFRGTGKSECIDFIRAVHKYAKQNQKVRDNQWIADEVYDAFDGDALLWYARLPVDVRGDWERLQEALISRWTTDDEVDNLSTGISSLAILPTPAAAPAAPLPNPAPSITSPQTTGTAKIGRLRIRANRIADTRYLSRNVVMEQDPWSGSFNVTIDAASALKVRLVTTAPGFYRLELVEHESELSVLAALTYLSNDWDDASCWGFLVGVDVPGWGFLGNRRTTYNGNNDRKGCQFWTERWQLEGMGRLKLRGPRNRAEAARFTVGIADNSEDILWLNGPNVLLNDREVETEVEFEPL